VCTESCGTAYVCLVLQGDLPRMAAIFFFDIDDFVEVEISGYRLCASGILLHEANRKARPLDFGVRG
jgi:hypothetical protein